MISYTKLALVLLLTVTGFAVLGYGVFAVEDCFGTASVTGQCSRVPGYVLQGLGYAGAYSGSYLRAREVRQSWKSLSSKRAVLALAAVGVVVGGVLGDAGYFLARALGLVVANYLTCGGYSTPLSCFTFNPGVPIWFILTAGVAGCGLFIFLALWIVSRTQTSTLLRTLPTNSLPLTCRRPL